MGSPKLLTSEGILGKPLWDREVSHGFAAVVAAGFAVGFTAGFAGWLGMGSGTPRHVGLLLSNCGPQQSVSRGFASWQLWGTVGATSMVPAMYG